MSILFITTYSPSLINFRGELLKKLAKDKFKVIGLAPFKFSEKNIQKQLISFGIKTAKIYFSKDSKNLIKEFVAIFSILLRVIQFNPKKIFVYSTKPIIYTGLLISFLKLFPKYKKLELIGLITGIGSAFPRPRSKKNIFNKFVIFFLKLGFYSFEKIIFQNNEDKADLICLGIISSKTRLFRVNGSGVDLKKFSYKKNVFNESMKFLMLSRLLIDKGVREYAEAARLIKKEFPEVTFKLAGMLYEGKRSININEINKWEEENTLTYIGLLNDVKSSLIECNCLILPSFYREGIPRSLMEAMAIGRPIITTNSIGCKECIKDNLNGFMINPKDIKALYFAIKKMIKQKKSLTIKMGMEGRLIAEKKFDVHDINKEIIDIINS